MTRNQMVGEIAHETPRLKVAHHDCRPCIVSRPLIHTGKGA